jgi:hypothetical protein
MKEINEEKYDKALEWLENALLNIENIKHIGIALLPVVEEQIKNAIKYLEDEEVDDGVMGKVESKSGKDI